MDVPGVLTDVPSLRRALDVLLAEDGVDVVILHMAAVYFTESTAGNVPEFCEVIADTLSGAGRRKPIVMALDDAYPYEGTETRCREFRAAGVPAYRSIRSACRAVRRVSDYLAAFTGDT